MDAKGRVSIPASFRRVIEAADPDWTQGLRPVFAIAHGEEGRPYLEGYSMAALDELHARIEQMQPGSRAREVMEDLYFSRVQDFQIDDDGRIVLPGALRDKIGLDGMALFVAKGNRFEIWDPEAYRNRRASRTSDFLREQGEDFHPHALLPHGGSTAGAGGA